MRTLPNLGMPQRKSVRMLALLSAASDSIKDNAVKGGDEAMTKRLKVQFYQRNAISVIGIVVEFVRSKVKQAMTHPLLKDVLLLIVPNLSNFYDGFSLRAEVGIRSSALVAFHLQEEDVSNDLVLSQAAVVAKGWVDHQEQPVDHTAPEADRRNVPDEIISVSDSEVDHDSTNGGCSSQNSCSTTSEDESSESEPAMSEVSVQHSMLEHAYQSIKNAFHCKQWTTGSRGWRIESIGKPSTSLATGKACPAVEVWCPQTRWFSRWLFDGVNGHAFGSVALSQTNQLLCQNFNGSWQPILRKKLLRYFGRCFTIQSCP